MHPRKDFNPRNKTLWFTDNQSDDPCALRVAPEPPTIRARTIQYVSDP